MSLEHCVAVPTKAKNKPIPARRFAPGQTAVRRTRVANGKALLAPEGNANGWWARRFGEVVSLRLDDLGLPETLSESQVSLTKRAAALEVSLEIDEAAMSRGDDVNLKTYAEVAGQLTRILVALGLKRVPRRALTLQERAVASDWGREATQ